MSTAWGRPQGGWGPAHVDSVSQKPDYFVDIINGWPLAETPTHKCSIDQLIYAAK